MKSAKPRNVQTHNTATTACKRQSYGAYGKNETPQHPLKRVGGDSMARSSAWTRLSRQFKDEGAKSNAPCWLCGLPIDYNDPTGRYGHAADHVLPVSQYPEHELDLANLRHAHIGCNSSRGNNTPTVKVNKTLQF